MGFQVTLQPSGHSFEVPDGKPVLNAGLEAGFMLPYSCRSGVCRTCRGKIVEGRVDYGSVHPTYLPDGHKAQGLVLLCQATALSDLVVEVHELSGTAIKPKMIPCRVVKIDRPAPDVAVLKLQLPMNENMMFSAGQYLDFILKDGKRRSYSIATAPAPEGVVQLELHLRHTPRGVFTDHVFTKMKERELLRFEGPLGSFFLREDSTKPIVLLASGTGFAPIRSIVDYALRKKLQRPMTLYWGCRQKRDLYMMEVAERWAADSPSFKFIPVLSDAVPEDHWSGRIGFVHRAVMEDFPDLSGYQVYACGAPIVIDSAQRDFTAQCELPEDEFFADSFLTEADKAGMPA